MGGGRGCYAGQPISFRCPKCFVMDGRRRGAAMVTLTGKTRAQRNRKASNYHRWGSTARQYRCVCGHVGWSRHPDLEKKAGAAEGSSS